MGKICVYTCITGDYDDVKELKLKEAGIDYLLFTDNKNLVSKTWKVIYIEDKSLDSHRLSRKIKILGHPIIDTYYKISVWVDASMIIEGSIKEFIDKYCELEQYDFAVCKHRARDCVYDEAEACIILKKDDPEVIHNQMEMYRKEGYPEHGGLIEATVFVKRHRNHKVRKVMSAWFEMVRKYSRRDQLSFNYIARKVNFQYKAIDMNIFENSYFTWVDHK